MKNTRGIFRAMAFVSGMVCASAASATVGYFALGYGAKAMGLAGAVVSNPQDTAVIAVNPAGLTELGKRVDGGLRFFNPNREAELSTAVPADAFFPGSAAINFNVDDKSRRNLFLIPNFGFNLQFRDNLWFGFSNYGNGGMNSTYDRNLYNEAGSALAAATGRVPDPNNPGSTLPPFSPPEGFAFPLPETGTLGVDLAQAIYAPALAMKVNDKHSLGAALLLGLQRFSARGLGNFQCFTQTGQSDPAGTCAASGGAITGTPSDGLTGNNSDWAYGAGVRVGWLGEVHPRLTLGASYSTKIYMTEFDDYDELFAEHGDFDIPANFTLGATFKATPKLKLSFDFQQIQYEGVNSISNAGPALGPSIPPGGGLLGTENGLGFGWEDINIYRLAAEYTYSNQWTFRAGVAVNDQPIPSSEVLFNILAPAVIERHATLGFTFNPDKKSEWSFAYMRAFSEEVSSSQTAFGVPGSIKMDQHSIDLGYSYKF